MMRLAILILLAWAVPAVAAPDPIEVSPSELAGRRIAGEKQIEPDDDTRAEMIRAHKDRVIGSFKICIDREGKMENVRVVKSTGFPAYDRKLKRKMMEWRYEPYTSHGKPVPMCGVVTFIYHPH
jgi:TonB family protein